MCTADAVPGVPAKKRVLLAQTHDPCTRKDPRGVAPSQKTPLPALIGRQGTGAHWRLRSRRTIQPRREQIRHLPAPGLVHYPFDLQPQAITVRPTRSGKLFIALT